MFAPTDWTDVVLLREVLRRSYDMAYAGRMVRQDDRPCLARTVEAGREIRGVAAMHAADGIAAWRWWTLTELDETDEEIWPPELVGLIRRNLRTLHPQGCFQPATSCLCGLQMQQ
jgi:hypothetical protein